VPTNITFEVMTFYHCEQGIIHVLFEPIFKCSNCVIHNSRNILANCLILLYEQHAPTYAVYRSATIGHLKIKNHKFERAENFKYLGVILNEDNNYQRDLYETIKMLAKHTLGYSLCLKIKTYQRN
jgi:hypothetical protein